MPRERKPSAKVAFMESSSADWEAHQKQLDATKSERKRGSGGTTKAKSGKSKRPLSAYMHFSKAMRSEVTTEYPDASFGEVGKILGEWWSDCSAQERAKYDKMAKDDKAAHGITGGKAKSKSTPSVPKLSYFDMSKEAIKALKNRKGSSHNAIEAYIKQQYPDLDYKRHLLRKSLKTGADNGKLVRNGNSFKLKK
jgi:hypothetical protein